MDFVKGKIPVLILVYNRPWNLRVLIQALKVEKPEVVYVSSDGPKNKEDAALVQECREIIEEEIDWPCRVIKFYNDENKGMYVASPSARDRAVTGHLGIVSFEDDCIPKEGFFEYLRSVLACHSENSQIVMVCGHNPIGRTPLIFAKARKYSSTRRARVWGNYMKSDFWTEFRKETTEYELSVLDCFKESIWVPGLISKVIHLRMLLNLRHRLGPGDILLNRYIRKMGYLAIVPIENLVDNIGDGLYATHTKELPDIKFRRSGNIDFSTPDSYGLKRLKRVDVLDGWLLAFWWVLTRVGIRKRPGKI